MIRNEAIVPTVRRKASRGRGGSPADAMLRTAALLSWSALGACAVAGTDVSEEAVWQAMNTPAGATLTAADEAGPVLQVSCRGDRMIVQAFRFTPVGSNEEFAFGTADESHLFVADPTADVEGVVASGPIRAPLLDSLMSAGAVSAVYGDQVLGPLVLPRNRADPFVGACLA